MYAEQEIMRGEIEELLKEADRPVLDQVKRDCDYYIRELEKNVEAMAQSGVLLNQDLTEYLNRRT